MNKYILPLMMILGSLTSVSQVDTVKQGVVSVLDTVSLTEQKIPFKNNQCNGVVKTVSTVTGKVLIEGTCKENQKQGVWNYFEYDSLGNSSVRQYFTYENDTLNGAFVEQVDSLRITGYYEKGKLNGAYNEDLLLLDDSGKIVIQALDSGQYKQGVKYGLWTYLHQGLLHKMGNYEKGKYHLHWKIYDVSDAKNHRLMNDIQYFEGVKTGKEINYFRYDTLTDTGEIILVEEYEQIPWQSGKRNGAYFRKNKQKIVLEAGTYSDDIKIGKWEYRTPEEQKLEVKTYLNNQLNGPYTITIGEQLMLSGVYALGKKNKNWVYYDKSGKMIREELYENGIKNGDWKYFNPDGALDKLIVLENDEPVEFVDFDQDERELVTMNILEHDQNKVRLSTVLNYPDSSVAKEVVTIMEGDQIDPLLFFEDFIQYHEDTTKYKWDGGYAIKHHGEQYISGVFKHNIMHGEWDYYYNSRIIWRKKYVNGFMAEEQFIDKATNQLVEKGEYVLWYGPERPEAEFKIQNGVRHGKSIWYKKNGETSKVEKYKEGELQ